MERQFTIEDFKTWLDGILAAVNVSAEIDDPDLTLVRKIREKADEVVPTLVAFDVPTVTPPSVSPIQIPMPQDTNILTVYEAGTDSDITE